MVKPETKFVQSFKEAFDFQYPNGFWLSIPDCIKSSKTRFLPTKKADVLIVVNRQAHLIEFKNHTKNESWPIREVRESQFEGLHEALCKGLYAHIILHVEYETTNFCRIFHPSMLQAEERKSITIEGLKQGLTIERKKIKVDKKSKLCWDLDFLK